jgi:hypothetical protein
MKILINLFLIIFCTSISFGQSHKLKLPEPSKEFYAMKDTCSMDFSYLYLSTYFKTVSVKPIANYDNSTRLCAWQQFFTDSISYSYNSCNENGFNTTILFPNADKDDIVKFVNWLFGESGSAWDKKKLIYRPKDGGPGCYFQIKVINGDIVLSYNCGC